MRNSLLRSMTLGLGALLGLAAFSAQAIPIHVGLQNAAGSHSWDSPVIGDPHGILNLTAWEYDSGAWTAAVMTYKASTPAETGLGVACNQHPTHNACSQKEIGTTPWQMIDLNIKDLTGWSSLTVNLSSVNGTGYPGGDETGYLLGAACSVNFTDQDLLGVTDIWVTPSLRNQSGRDDGNILLGADFILYTVPEPAALGIFGFGVLLVGLLLVLRRHRSD